MTLWCKVRAPISGLPFLQFSLSLSPEPVKTHTFILILIDIHLCLSVCYAIVCTPALEQNHADQRVVSPYDCSSTYTLQHLGVDLFHDSICSKWEQNDNGRQLFGRSSRTAMCLLPNPPSMCYILLPLKMPSCAPAGAVQPVNYHSITLFVAETQ